MTLHHNYTASELIHRILETSDVAEQRCLLSAHWRLIDDTAAETLKSAVEDAIRVNLQHATQLAELIEYAAELSGNQSHRALALLAKGNIYNIGMGEYEQAVGIYADALTLYQELGNELGMARVKLGRLWALSWLGKHSDAFADAEDCLRIFREHEKWNLLVTTMENLSQVYAYSGNDMLALYWLDEAEEIVQHFLPHRKEYLISIQQNRAISLRNIGRFDECIVALLLTREHLLQIGQVIDAARATQILATTYYLLGRYNEAIVESDEAYRAFAQDQRWVDAMFVERFLSECYLQLRRFDEVIDICSRIRQRFQEQHVDQIVGELMVNEASAYIQLKNYEAARKSLNEALKIFEKLNLPIWIAIAQTEMATLYQNTKFFQKSMQLACTAALLFQKQSRPFKEADAWLVAADSALQVQHDQETQLWIERALQIGTEREIPFTIFQCMRLQGLLYESKNDFDQALTCYEAAIVELEKLRSRLMLEHRSKFLDDKNAVFESAAYLCLNLGKIEQALGYSERAKSRALVDLLDQQLNLKIRARRPIEQPLVDELHQLMARRDVLHSQLHQSDGSALTNVFSKPTDSDREMLQTLEKKVTTQWHRLLTINADYARESSFIQSDLQPFQHDIPRDTVLLEYFVVKGNLVVFCVDSANVIAVQLTKGWHEIQALLQKWNLNISTVMRSSLPNSNHLSVNAVGILQKLYEALVLPVITHLNCKKLVIVPHGSLHYAPFHAFFDGNKFLIERFEVSYLPAASLLRFLTKGKTSNIGTLIYGNTHNRTLPYIAEEVKAISKIMNSPALLDNDINKSRLLAQMETASVIHLASHGQFHPDNPLFSGIQFADGWLTTLDVFNLHLDASLVTLSGCNTGRNHILGGDEVAGLMRAFLSAGAHSILLSLWPIDDRISAWAMQEFYTQCKLGSSHGDALRHLQIQCIHGAVPVDSSNGFRHPFYWAPFFLVGIS